MVILYPQCSIFKVSGRTTVVYSTDKLPACRLVNCGSLRFFRYHYFRKYTCLLELVTELLKIRYHFYVAETQIYLWFHQCDVQCAMARLNSCYADIVAFMAAHFL